MKLKVAALIMVAVAVACIIVWLTRSHQSEVLVSPGIALTPQWQEIHLARGLRTNAAWSELLLEMPSPQFRQVGGEVLLEDGTPFHIDGYLTTDTGEKVNLDRVGSVSYNGRIFFRLSTARLEWKQLDYRFPTVALRSDRSLKTGRVIWISYDPRATKDGVVFPRTLANR